MWYLKFLPTIIWGNCFFKQKANALESKAITFQKHLPIKKGCNCLYTQITMFLPIAFIGTSPNSVVSSLDKETIQGEETIQGRKLHEEIRLTKNQVHQTGYFKLEN